MLALLRIFHWQAPRPSKPSSPNIKHSANKLNVCRGCEFQNVDWSCRKPSSATYPAQFEEAQGKHNNKPRRVTETSTVTNPINSSGFFFRLFLFFLKRNFNFLVSSSPHAWENGSGIYQISGEKQPVTNRHPKTLWHTWAELIPAS